MNDGDGVHGEPSVKRAKVQVEDDEMEDVGLRI